MYNAVPPPNAKDDKSNPVAESRRELPPPGVSEAAWKVKILRKKFQELKERREKTCKVSSERRVKALKKKTLDPVFKELQSEEDCYILREHGVILPSNFKRRQNNKRAGTASDRGSAIERCTISVQDSTEKRLHKQKDKKADLEEAIQRALKEGQFDKAEEYSDALQDQDYAEKVHALLAAKDYSKRKSDQAEKAKKRKRIKLHWGFEQKERWESKGNM
ncbi:protein FAM204A isoform X2 [Nematostella vectensis]|uniref:protein FAM204A isoform X2 n=1 Tax=Nematostella vectensis TaxID=45351 RepID=UPI002077966F|nr:protein FAM204A isoform X2 [Nematostella vectensis]